ncbi:M15 family metallopeptidase [Hymenobacter metallicola]|uniref:M15 family peptidase n=1 Tax=Hymenobacter metallicola TaxID=2563114 RepID=A0A4Z0QJB8_9BACT|nr:M15 family metallopeptidase [Hymenobacter metallicola]TGE29785.1 M15 family peptidase [Hymenobacter metallicola]
MATTAQLTKRYGAAYPRSAAFETRWMEMYTLPIWLKPHFATVYEGKPVTRIWMNKDAIEPFEAVMHELVCTGLIHEIKTYDGCYNPRLMRGLNTPSVHSWGLAFDFNAKLNPLGKAPYGPGMFTREFVAVWKKHGFTAGADFGKGRSDAMHFEFTRKAV